MVSMKTFAVSLLALLPLASSYSVAGWDDPHVRRQEAIDLQLNMDGEGNFTASGVSALATWWLEGVQKQGIAAYNGNPNGYRVFRNVKDYGARGDGTTDDTNAINAAIQDGGRCGQGCDSSTVTPALVYFPSGTYRISRPIVAMYYSQLVGNPTDRPVIKGLPNFVGIALIDANPYADGGYNWYTNQNNFFRAVRNIVLDTTAQPLDSGTGIHWQVAQATSLVNMKFIMSQAAGNSHQGIFMENGSGGFMSDLEFVGGKFGAWLGNQQFMTRNLKFTNCRTAIFLQWNWQWTFKSVDINNCGVGIDFSALDDNGAANVGSIILLDSRIANTPIGLRTGRSGAFKPTSGGSAVLDNVVLQNVPQAVVSASGSVILGGGSLTIDLWGQGRTYNTAGAQTTLQGNMARPFSKPASLLDSTGKIFERSRPQYTNIPASNFISVRSHGARGDGSTDDTAAIKQIFAQFGGNLNNIIYFDHGVYLISDTVQIPVNTRIVGEVWSVISASGTTFKDRNNPKPVWRVGNPGDVGTVEMSELLFQTKGPQPGAILMQWHSRDPSGQQGANGIWDVHFRVAGSARTELEATQCIKNPNAVITPDARCEGSFMHLHIAKTASLYMENCWAWTSDHGMDAPFDQITVYNARGIYTESTNGPVWMYAGAAEHNVLYQFQLQNTKNIFMSTIQTETPYFQSNPGANVPFNSLSSWNDPSYAGCTTKECRKSWALRIINSSNVLIYSAGLYSFFENYAQECIPAITCQASIFEIRNSPQVVLYNLNSIASQSMVDYNGNKIVPANQNQNSYCQSIMKFAT